MPLTVSTGLSKKVGTASYGSVGATCNVTFEASNELLDSDLDAFQQKVKTAFVACRQAVNDQLARELGTPADNNGSSATSNGVAHTNGASSTNGNGSASNGNGQRNGHAASGFVQRRDRRIYHVRRNRQSDSGHGYERSVGLAVYGGNLFAQPCDKLSDAARRAPTKGLRR